MKPSYLSIIIAYCFLGACGSKNSLLQNDAAIAGIDASTDPSLQGQKSLDIEKFTMGTQRKYLKIGVLKPLLLNRETASPVQPLLKIKIRDLNPARDDMSILNTKSILLDDAVDMAYSFYSSIKTDPYALGGQGYHTMKCGAFSATMAAQRMGMEKITVEQTMAIMNITARQGISHADFQRKMETLTGIEWKQIPITSADHFTSLLDLYQGWSLPLAVDETIKTADGYTANKTHMSIIDGLIAHNDKSGTPRKYLIGRNSDVNEIGDPGVEIHEPDQFFLAQTEEPGAIYVSRNIILFAPK